jgi:hypothetical protein
MKFKCECGHVIADQTDSLPYKCDLLPDDGTWDAFHWPIVLAMVEFAKSTANGDREGWLSRHFGTEYSRDLDDKSVISDLISGYMSRLRTMYQCTECGSLFIQKRLGGEFVMFKPADDDWHDILTWRM